MTDAKRFYLSYAIALGQTIIVDEMSVSQDAYACIKVDLFNCTCHNVLHVCALQLIQCISCYHFVQIL